jgi:GT2 family glycosyltransferase
LQPEVSIITVYYNCRDDLFALRESMQKFLSDSPIEWIIADNNSRENLAGNFPEAIYLRLDENFGFAKANNRAVEKATAPYLFFVNPDCLFIENCLPVLKRALEHSAVAGPKVLNENGTIQLSFGPFLSIWNEFLQQRRMHREKTAEIQSWIRTKGEFHPDYVSGCALMIRADLYRSIGGFDERFFLYEEDVDLCKRIREKDHQVTYVPSASIVHRRNTSVELFRTKANAEYRKSHIYYYRKHLGILQNLLLKLYLR